MELLLPWAVMVRAAVQWRDSFFLDSNATTHLISLPGVVNFWDKDNKQRLKGFSPIDRTIPCAAFNKQGNLFAYASSYDWSKGCTYVPPSPGNDIFIHSVMEDEIRPKGSKASTGYKR